ncbi:hypothetical protein HYH03_002246 [Edaphochlamys debaryana]|uniref:Uncharacterized protein n=1 Tax=Edaphochlamys debaryana TaxID=47281 RepID=A0A836C4A8_9CHLO|nr:hypothetical protein HYH03_002246 [Edaphochlamys debaryana]|eukprot:KAG2499961.1 hypothetical protein HYH03_002246 [Edaphochlamys debaryana]
MPLLVRAVAKPTPPAPKRPETQVQSLELLWQRAAAAIAATSTAFFAATGVAWADADALLQDSDLLGTQQGTGFSFTGLLVFTLLTYWVIKATMYLLNNPLDRPERNAEDDKSQDPSKALTDVGHAHIRSYLDPARGDAKELRLKTLARHAAYRVASQIREAQPRIHSLVEELAGPASAASGAWPPPPPRNMDLDAVAQLVYARVVQERGAKTADHELCPRERAALELTLLEEVAERTASEEVAEFMNLAAKGLLVPRTAAQGAGQTPPTSHAH